MSEFKPRFSCEEGLAAGGNGAKKGSPLAQWCEEKLAAGGNRGFADTLECFGFPHRVAEGCDGLRRNE